MTNKPIITVGITAYKISKYLNRALQSVINQTSNQWRGVLILDGGNDKKTKKIFKSFSHSNFIKHSLLDRQGPYGTRNKAIELCSTDWYYQLDGDDMLPHNSIELILSKIEENKNIEYIYGNCEHFSKKYSSIRKPSADFEDLCFGPLFNAASPVKKQTILNLGGFSKKLIINADWDFWLKVHREKIKGEYIDEIIYKRRDRENNVGNEMMLKRPAVVKKIIKNHSWFFNIGDRKKKTMATMYRKLAGFTKSTGDRKKSKFYAEKAIKNESKSFLYKDIFREAEMFYLRYKLRRLFRFFSTFQNKYL